MTGNDKQDKVEIVSCEVCLKEVPVDETNNPETADYVAHFCGLECYEKWVAQDAGAENKDDKSAS